MPDTDHSLEQVTYSLTVHHPRVGMDAYDARHAIDGVPSDYIDVFITSIGST